MGETFPRMRRFVLAKPVWLKGREEEMNVTAGFRLILKPGEGGADSVLLRLTASSIYRFFVNGSFAGHGPAVAPHGYFRIDEWEIARFIHEGENVIAIEVAGYNVNSFYTLDQPSFLQAELLRDGEVIAATGWQDRDFEGKALTERVQRVQRFSYQRPFVEAYRLSEISWKWREDPKAAFYPESLGILPDMKLLHRGVDYPKFHLRFPERGSFCGTIERGMTGCPLRDRSLLLVGTVLKGYPIFQLERVYSDELQLYRSHPATGEEHHPKKFVLKENQYRILDFGINSTGFLGATLSCSSKTRLYFLFDETLTDGDVDFQRLNCCSMIHLELAQGEFRFESMEPYTLKYVKVMVIEGECAVSDVYLREYAAGNTEALFFTCDDERINRIFAAGVETYRQNAVDNFTDCPSRERAGWLCDSFFTARTSFDVTGKTDVELNFLENYTIPEGFHGLPEGMLPMCYPADVINGEFIPNWALWYILQLEEFASRDGGGMPFDIFLPKVEGLIRYFSKYENELGLLEDLDGWVFVEWSKANDFTAGVNFPSNMLYAGALSAAGRLFGRQDWLQKAEGIRERIRSLSYRDGFFCDHAVRKEGVLHTLPDRTEVCQYYAFYFGIASPSDYPDLWRRLIEHFGPKREMGIRFLDVYSANTFIGHYLRLELLSRLNLKKEILTETVDYFAHMAEETGTLWEHMDTRASLNHGFASHIVHLLIRDIAGIRSIDPVSKKIVIDRPQPHMGIHHLHLRLPLGEGMADLEWRFTEGDLEWNLSLPEEFTFSIRES